MEEACVVDTLVSLAANARVRFIIEKSFSERLAQRAQLLASQQEGDLPNLHERVLQTEKSQRDIKQRAVLFQQLIVLNPFLPLQGASANLVEQASKELGLSFVQNEIPNFLDTRGVSRAAVCARARLPAAWRQSECAQFRLDELLKRWPQDAARAATATSERQRLSASWCARLAAIAAGARLALTRAGVSAAIAVRDLSVAEEAAACDTAEAAFLRRIRVEVREAARLRERAVRFRVVSSFSAVPEQSEARRLVCATLAELAGAADRVGEFEAFPAAQHLACVRALMGADRMPWHGLFVSLNAPLLACLPHEKLRNCSLVISACGTVCAYNFNAEGQGDMLFLRHFASQRERTLRINGLRWACVYARQLFVGVSGATCVFHTPLDAAFGGLSFDEFSAFPIPEEIFSAVTDRAADGLIVGAKKGFHTDTLICVDLRARTARKVMCARRFNTIGPLTGIRVPGALCVAREHHGREATFIAFADGHVEEVARGAYRFPTLLPSAEHPADASRAAALDWNAHVSFLGTAKPLLLPVRPFRQAVVRLYRDVFLCPDQKTETWRAVRISVP